MMKTTKVLMIMILIILFSAILNGCGNAEQPAKATQDDTHSINDTSCKAPMISTGNNTEECCLDSDSNGICDSQDLKKTAEEKKRSEGNISSECAALDNLSVDDDSRDLEAEAQETAETFVKKWQNKEYNIMYALLVPKLKQKRSIKEFTAVFELDPLYKRITEVKLQGVNMLNKELAEINIKVKTSTQEINIPKGQLRIVNGRWRIEIFDDIFTLSAFDAACSGYLQSKSYKISDCAFDYALLVQEKSYCAKAGCKYIECLEKLEQKTGMIEEVQQCRMCPPFQTTVNDCILDIAINRDMIEVCDTIEEDKYTDKYCGCYGGFARNAENPEYCEAISIETYRDLCMTGFEGGNC